MSSADVALNKNIFVNSELNNIDKSKHFNPNQAGLFGGSFFWGGGQFDPPFRNTEPQML